MSFCVSELMNYSINDFVGEIVMSGVFLLRQVMVSSSYLFDEQRITVAVDWPLCWAH